MTLLEHRRALMSVKKSLLPSAYRQVGYIESTGTQYIDTAFLPTNKTKIEMEYLSTKQIKEPFEVLFGCQDLRVTSNQKRFFILEGTTNTLQFNMGFGDTVVRNETIIDNTKHKYILDTSTKTVSYIGQTFYYSPNLFNVINYSIYVFGRNEQGDAGHLAKGKLYSFKIYENKILVKNFIPCYRKADNEIGLYDIANDVFYTNKGTGTFLKGGDI